MSMNKFFNILDRIQVADSVSPGLSTTIIDHIKQLSDDPHTNINDLYVLMDFIERTMKGAKESIKERILSRIESSNEKGTSLGMVLEVSTVNEWDFKVDPDFLRFNQAFVNSKKVVDARKDVLTKQAESALAAGSTPVIPLISSEKHIIPKILE